MEWKLAEAKNRLSELVTRAATEGPQTIRRHDQAFIVIAEPAYRALTDKRLTFKDWLLGAPRIEDLKLPKRARSLMRNPNL